MRVVRGLECGEASDHPAFVVVGVFDGLHLGHAYLLHHLVEESARRGARPVVVTFDHHPDELIRGSAPPLLCDPDERLERLEAAGVDTTVVVHFDRRLRETPYDAFVDELAACGPLAGFLMTPDAAFGYERGGTPEALVALGRDRGFDVVVVPPFELDGRPVRSTEVRAAIEAGDLARAARLLGRKHAVVGVAEPADLGTALRFPLPVALPPNGDWAASLDAGAGPRPGSVRVASGRVYVPKIMTGGRVRAELTGREDPGEQRDDGM